MLMHIEEFSAGQHFITGEGKVVVAVPETTWQDCDGCVFYQSKSCYRWGHVPEGIDCGDTIFIEVITSNDI